MLKTTRIRRTLVIFVRRTLLTLGLVMLLAVPFSFIVPVRGSGPLPTRGSVILVYQGGAFEAHLFSPNASTSYWIWWIRYRSQDPDDPILSRAWLIPQATRRVMPLSGHSETRLYLPIWLVAASCLAWPGTSTFLARRRLRPGFPVELSAD